MSTSALAGYQNQIPEKGSPSLGFFESLKVASRVFFEGGRRPLTKLPEVVPDYESFLSPDGEIKFIWFGHSTLLLNLDGKIVLIDPVFHHASPVSFLVKRFQPPVTPVTELPAIDVIVISHDHYDHLDRLTVEAFQEKSTHFIVPSGVGNHLRDWGIPRERITELGWHERTLHRDLKFTATPAQHFSGRGPFDRNESLWASWIIEGMHEKVYYSGDSGYGPHFREIGNKYGPFDFAFIENGQYNERWPEVHLHPDQTIEAYFDLKAKTLIPVHWGMFDLALHHWTEPVVYTHTLAKNWGIPMLTPKLGEIVHRGNHPTSAWWSSYLPEHK